MKTFIYDTETTGFTHGSKPLDHPHQPYLVQIGGMLVDDDTRRTLAEINLIAIPEWNGEIKKVPKEASDIHGIDDVLIEQVGLPYKVVIPIFNQLARKADRFVCHNAGYDYPIMKIGYARNGFNAETLLKTPHYCTMLTTTPLLKLPHKKGGSGYKWPSLMEAYMHYVDENGFEGAHDAMEDVRATAKVFYALLDAGIEIKAL